MMFSISLLIGGPIEFGSQNTKGQFLNPAGFDWMFMFALQDGQLLTKNKYLQIFFPV